MVVTLSASVAVSKDKTMLELSCVISSKVGKRSYARDDSLSASVQPTTNAKREVTWHQEKREREYLNRKDKMSDKREQGLNKAAVHNAIIKPSFRLRLFANSESNTLKSQLQQKVGGDARGNFFRVPCGEGQKRIVGELFPLGYAKVLSFFCIKVLSPLASIELLFSKELTTHLGI